VAAGMAYDNLQMRLVSEVSTLVPITHLSNVPPSFTLHCKCHLKVLIQLQLCYTVLIQSMHIPTQCNKFKFEVFHTSEFPEFKST
jgi:hypothetical protein